MIGWVTVAVAAPLVIGDVQGLPPDLDGVDLVTPGMVDAHAHPGWLGQVLEQVDLTPATSYRAALDLLRAAPAGDGWVRGHGWDQTRWPDAPRGGWPLAKDLARIFGDRAVWLTRVDGHAAWASPSVLRALPPHDPPGGRVIRARGRPTGVLVDGAMALVAVPEPGDAEVGRQLLAGLTHLAARGYTGVHAMAASDAELRAYADIGATAPLDVRVWAMAGTAGAEALLSEGPRRHGRVRVVGVKAFADGALGSRGALLSAPYADEPATSGLGSTTEADTRALAVRGLRAGVSIAVHAIGDLAVSQTLSAFEAARAEVPDAHAVPLRVEHAQVVRPADRPRFAAARVIASMQPTHCTSDLPWAAQRLGADRIGWAYAWRSLADAGAVLAFGTDVPVEAVDLDAALRAGTCRCRGEATLVPEESLTLEAVVAAFTVGARAAAGEPAATSDLTLWRRVDGGFVPVGRRYAGVVERW